MTIHGGHYHIQSASTDQYLGMREEDSVAVPRLLKKSIPHITRWFIHVIGTGNDTVNFSAVTIMHISSARYVSPRSGDITAPLFLSQFPVVWRVEHVIGHTVRLKWSDNAWVLNGRNNGKPAGSINLTPSSEATAEKACTWRLVPVDFTSGLHTISPKLHSIAQCLTWENHTITKQAEAQQTTAPLPQYRLFTTVGSAGSQFRLTASENTFMLQAHGTSLFAAPDKAVGAGMHHIKLQKTPYTGWRVQSVNSLNCWRIYCLLANESLSLTVNIDHVGHKSRGHQVHLVKTNPNNETQYWFFK